MEININEIKEIRTRTTTYLGCGAIKKISYIADNLSKMGIKRVIIISGKSAYKKTGAWGYVEKALKDSNITYINYDKVIPNPTTELVDEATKLACDFQAQAVIAIGGGSAIDTGKSVACLIKNNSKTAEELYTFKFTPSSAVPIIAINMTHGTGSEANRFAVVSILKDNFKPAIAYDCLYPMYAIDDPELMITLSPEQTRYVSIDVINHSLEASTSKTTSPYAITLAKEAIMLVAKYLPKVLDNPKDLEARYFLAYASLIGGLSFDNGLLHFTHALEHPLSAVKPKLAHGLGLALILPSVIKAIYPARPKTMTLILRPLALQFFSCDNRPIDEKAKEMAVAVQDWLISVGVNQKLSDIGFTESDIDELVNLTFKTPSLNELLSVAPIKADRKVIHTIYKEALLPYK